MRQWIRRHRATTLAIANTLILLLLWLSNQFLCEASWFTMAFAYVPQVLYAIPTIVLIVAFLFRRRWWLLVGQITLLTAFLIASAGLTWQYYEAPKSEPWLKVQTMNIQRGRHGIGEIVRHIRNENADILCLQECDLPPEERLVEQLRAALPEYLMFHSNGVLIASRLPVIGFNRYPLPYGKPLIEIQVRWMDQVVSIANVHLVAIFLDRYLVESPGKIPAHLREAGAQREEQLKAILAYARRTPDLILNRKPRLILCGDFNAPANSGFHRRLGENLRDSFLMAGSGFGYTVPAQFPLMRLDFIYTSTDMIARTCEVPAAVVSDHRGVVANIEWLKE